jgi:short-subunit dehydrogenase
MSSTTSSAGHVVITGASAGIGEHLARAFSERGFSLTLVARRAELLSALRDSLPSPSHIVVQDLSDPERAADFLPVAEQHFGPIDVLVNNAGVQYVSALADFDPARGEQLLRLNLLTPLRLTRAILPSMISRRKGTIVDIASLAALAPTPYMVYYNAAKAGIAAASESLRAEVVGSGVHIVTVYPGPVETAMARAGYAAYGDSLAVRAMPRGTPDELARRILSAIDHRDDRVIYPSAYWSARWFPGVTRWFLDTFTPAPGPHES